QPPSSRIPLARWGVTSKNEYFSHPVHISFHQFTHPVLSCSSFISKIDVLPSNQEIGRPIGVPVHEAAAVLEALLVVIVKRNGGSCSRWLWPLFRQRDQTGPCGALRNSGSNFVRAGGCAGCSLCGRPSPLCSKRWPQS